MDNQKLGKLGEDAAAAYLQEQGYRILCRNFRCRMGEIDLIAAKGYGLTFVEVKTRRNDCYGRPCESVTSRKRGRLKAAADYYLSTRPKNAFRPQSLRFDVLEIEIHHITDVI